jgi:cholesterol transport system auxiliary component
MQTSIRAVEAGAALVKFSTIPTILGLALVTASLPACALFGGSPKPLDTYELSAPGPKELRSRGRTQILIAEPSALKALDSQNIVIRPAPGVIEYLSGAQWADRLPAIVQARLAETFQKSGAFGGVGTPGEGLAIDYQIVTEVRAFEIRTDGGGRAHVQLFVRILNDSNGVVRAARAFEANAAVSGTGSDANVNALDRAFGEAASDIVDWTDSLI